MSAVYRLQITELMRRTDDHSINYSALAKFRHHVCSFFAFSEAALHDAQLMPMQYQAMLAIAAKADEGLTTTASTLASELFIRLNTAVELIDRLVGAGYVKRARSMADRRKVELTISAEGSKKLAPLAILHLEHHRKHIDELFKAMNELAPVRPCLDRSSIKTDTDTSGVG